MLRNYCLGGLGLATLLTCLSPAQGQVVVRTPYARVAVGGGGVQVQAPFVNLQKPFMGTARVQKPVAAVPGPIVPRVEIPSQTLPPVAVVPGPIVPQVEIPGQDPTPAVPGPIVPQVEIPGPPPAVLNGPRPMTLKEFANCFDPKPGKYEVVLINPVTCQPACVRFCLEKCVRRIVVNHDSLVLRYGLCHAVRIDFNCHGAVVTCR